MKIRAASSAYVLLALILGCISLLHMGTTFSLRSANTFTRIWFFGSGLAMAYDVALNLLNWIYGRSAAGLRWTARAFNLFMLTFATVAGIFTSASVWELAILLGILFGLLILSFSAAAYKNRFTE
jgi:hypothetical protein